MEQNSENVECAVEDDIVDMDFERNLLVQILEERYRISMAKNPRKFNEVLQFHLGLLQQQARAQKPRHAQAPLQHRQGASRMQAQSQFK